ncbi:MAG: hypothetical protein HUU14_11625 [Dehalococcoidia bacterium]|nr:hypothetical protein [Dehalococcoidia bacterium]NUQ56527.1 hypothetical protein [Dehalococcoidia bacterium]
MVTLDSALGAEGIKKAHDVAEGNVGAGVATEDSIENLLDARHGRRMAAGFGHCT